MKERTKKIMENPPASKTSSTILLPPSAAERQLLRPIKINILTVSGVQKVRIQNCNIQDPAAISQPAFEVKKLPCL